MVKKIALEEHFLCPGFIEYWNPTVAEMPAAKRERLLALNTDFGEQRLASMDRAGIERASVRSTTPVLREAQERALAMRVLGYGTVVAETVERTSPHRLCTYLYELASDFTAFYEHCPVLKAPDASTRASRLALSDVTARVLAHGLQLLGIEAPDQM